MGLWDWFDSKRVLIRVLDETREELAHTKEVRDEWKKAYTDLAADHERLRSSSVALSKNVLGLRHRDVPPPWPIGEPEVVGESYRYGGLNMKE